MTITSRMWHPLLRFRYWLNSRTVIYDQMASLWVEYHVTHVFYGSKFRRPSLSIFSKIFSWDFWDEFPSDLLSMIWLADRRQRDQIRQKVIELLSAAIFLKKEFYQFKMILWSSRTTLKNSPSKFTLSESRVTLPL